MENQNEPLVVGQDRKNPTVFSAAMPVEELLRACEESIPVGDVYRIAYDEDNPERVVAFLRVGKIILSFAPDTPATSRVSPEVTAPPPTPSPPQQHSNGADPNGSVQIHIGGPLEPQLTPITEDQKLLEKKESSVSSTSRKPGRSSKKSTASSGANKKRTRKSPAQKSA